MWDGRSRANHIHRDGGCSSNERINYEESARFYYFIPIALLYLVLPCCSGSKESAQRKVTHRPATEQTKVMMFSSVDLGNPSLAKRANERDEIHRAESLRCLIPVV